MKKDVIVVGAGLVGSLLSIYLAKKGYKVTVYERRGDMRRMQVEAGRSINLALSDRGIKALKEVGIADEVLQIAIPMHGRHIHNPDGTHAYQPCRQVLPPEHASGPGLPRSGHPAACLQALF